MAAVHSLHIFIYIRGEFDFVQSGSLTQKRSSWCCYGFVE